MIGDHLLSLRKKWDFPVPTYENERLQRKLLINEKNQRRKRQNHKNKNEENDKNLHRRNARRQLGHFPIRVHFKTYFPNYEQNKAQWKYNI